MKQYDEWKKSFHYGYPGGQIKPEGVMMEEAFKAGMLAAADMVEEEVDTRPIEWKTRMAAYIREAADE